MTSLRAPASSRPRRPIAAPRIAPRPTGVAPRRPPEDLAVALAFALLEFEAGRRPLAQFQRILTPTLASRLDAAGRERARSRAWAPSPTLTTVGPRLVDRPSNDVCEVAIVLRTQPRASVLAVRLERHRSSWRVVELARP